MTSIPTRTLFASALCWALVIVGCGSDSARPFGGDGTGGNQGTGGKSTGNDGGSGAVSGGGVSGSGGVMGSGGITGSGGRPGTGGTPGTGGVIGSGGITGSGGSGGTGTGGKPGTGGLLGTGGIGTGGTAGGSSSGGAGGANPTTCNGIATEYANEFQNAKMCLVASIVPQCQAAVPNTLFCTIPCTTYVQNATTLHQIMNRWQTAGCTPFPCPGVCVPAQPGNCTITAAAPAGMCQSGPPTPTQ